MPQRESAQSRFWNTGIGKALTAIKKGFLSFWARLKKAIQSLFNNLTLPHNKSKIKNLN